MFRWREVLVVASLAGLTVACDTAYEDDDDDDTNPAFPVDGATGSGAAYGPDNSWYHASESEIPAGLEGTGRNTGDIAPNLFLTDQFGDEVELYQFYGQVVLLDVYAEW